jgi:hypothetical protein
MAYLHDLQKYASANRLFIFTQEGNSGLSETKKKTREI